MSFLHHPFLTAAAGGVMATALILSILGLGALPKTEDRLDALGVGVVLFAASFGVFGLLQIPLSWVAAALVAIGFCGLRQWLRLPWDVKYDLFRKTELRSLGVKERYFNRVAIALVVLFLFARLMAALYPQLQGDPLSYHVASAKIWAKADRLFFIPWLPWSLQGGAFEYLYTAMATFIWEPFTLLMASQVLHVIVGSIFAGIVICSLGRRLGIAGPILAVVVLMGLLVPIDSAMMVRAKNDGAVLLLCGLALRSWWDDRLRLMALFAGGATACKWSALFFVIPLAATVLIVDVRSLGIRLAVRRSLVWLVGLAVALPVAARNWLWTDNPMFPAMGKLFPSSQLTPYLLEEVARYTYAGDFLSGLWQKAGWYVWSVPSVTLCLFIPWYWYTKEANKHAKHLPVLGLIVLVFYAAVTGAGGYVRFVLVLGVIAALLSGVVLQSLTDRFGLGVLAAALVGALINTGFDVPVSNIVFRTLPFWTYNGTTWQWLADESPLMAFQTKVNHLIGTTTTTTPTVILGCFENENLFLEGGQTIPQNHAGASRVFAAPNSEVLANSLKMEGFTHLLIRQMQSPCWQRFRDEPAFLENFSVVLEDANFVLYRPI